MAACTKCKLLVSNLLIRRAIIRGTRLLNQQAGQGGDSATGSSSQSQNSTDTSSYTQSQEKQFRSQSHTSASQNLEGEEAYEFEDEEGSAEEEEEETQEEHDTKQRILHASMAFVHQHGWTQRALSAGAESEGLPPIAHGMFPRGGADLVFYFQTSCNQHLADKLKAEVEFHKESEEKPKTKEFITDAIETRLRMIIPYIEIWPQAMAIQAMPQHATEAWVNLARLSDDIWYYAGDRSTDFNWYTKRAALAGVYKSTEIFMLQDKSENFEETWTFLSRRLDDLEDFGKMVRNSKQTTDEIASGLNGLALITKNLLGIGMMFRRK